MLLAVALSRWSTTDQDETRTHRSKQPQMELVSSWSRLWSTRSAQQSERISMSFLKTANDDAAVLSTAASASQNQSEIDVVEQRKSKGWRDKSCGQSSERTGSSSLSRWCEASHGSELADMFRSFACLGTEFKKG